ncbi:hypothetical protein J5I95_21305 [Candidatus Poribacteria bacterium]|nr:hypothetical protein [Candidatus Poribacteria bacterium]
MFLAIFNVKWTFRASDLTRHTSGVRSVGFSPNGTILASGSYDRTVRLWTSQ